MDLRKRLCDDPEGYENDPNVELQWAMMATQKAQIHTNLLLTSNTKSMKMCRDQDLIQTRFRETFPDLAVKEIKVEDLKGANIDKWRSFCNSLQEVKDFNFGALLRLRADQGYSNENTVFVPYIIFLAIEIARNIEGINEECKHLIQKNREELLNTNAEIL